jgi:hypothetical protein
VEISLKAGSLLRESNKRNLKSIREKSRQKKHLKKPLPQISEMAEESSESLDEDYLN